MVKRDGQLWQTEEGARDAARGSARTVGVEEWRVELHLQASGLKGQRVLCRLLLSHPERTLGGERG